MSEPLTRELEAFRAGAGVRGKGPLSVVLHVTRLANEEGLPLDVRTLRTAQQGQVRGLGRSRVQAILAAHGIERTLAAEGGRTSRGSLGLAESYASFLNGLYAGGLAELGEVEGWWAQRVREHFTARPLRLRHDPSRTLRAAIQDLLGQARAPQAGGSGTRHHGAVLQHLVGAKLELVLDAELAHHGASVADGPSARPGDFAVADAAIHVTTAPGAALIEKCRANVEAGLQLIIVTIRERVPVAEALAEDAGLGGRVEVWDDGPFLAANLHEHSRFSRAQQGPTLTALDERYNRIVAACETDPSLRIEFGG